MITEHSYVLITSQEKRRIKNQFIYLLIYIMNQQQKSSFRLSDPFSVPGAGSGSHEEVKGPQQVL